MKAIAKWVGAVAAVGALGAAVAAVGFADDIDQRLSSNEEQEVTATDDAQQPTANAFARDGYWGRGYYGPRYGYGYGHGYGRGYGYGPAYYAPGYGGRRWVPGYWGDWGYRRGYWAP